MREPLAYAHPISKDTVRTGHQNELSQGNGIGVIDTLPAQATRRKHMS